MTIQQQCAERIYELLPEKKELSFGCEVKPTYVGREDYGYNGVYILGHNGYYNKANSSTEALHYEPLDAGLFEIIGHPIRLADILRAMYIKARKDEDRKGYADYQVLDVVHKYNKAKDNILEQDTAFCEWLLEIIK